MGARVSAEMKQAQELLRAGHCTAEAAGVSGISKSAISKSAECRSIIKQREVNMQSSTESSIDTIAGLEEYFFDNVFYTNSRDYPSFMNRADFEKELESYVDGMNQCNDCMFPYPSNRTINRFYKKYVAEYAQMNQ